MLSRLEAGSAFGNPLRVHFLSAEPKDWRHYPVAASRAYHYSQLRPSLALGSWYVSLNCPQEVASKALGLSTRRSLVDCHLITLPSIFAVFGRQQEPTGASYVPSFAFSRPFGSSERRYDSYR